MFQSTDRVSKDLAAIKESVNTQLLPISMRSCELRQVQLGGKTVAAQGKYNAGLKFNERLW